MARWFTSKSPMSSLRAVRDISVHWQMAATPSTASPTSRKLSPDASLFLNWSCYRSRVVQRAPISLSTTRCHWTARPTSFFLIMIVPFPTPVYTNQFYSYLRVKTHETFEQAVNQSLYHDLHHSTWLRKSKWFLLQTSQSRNTLRVLYTIRHGISTLPLSYFSSLWGRQVNVWSSGRTATSHWRCHAPRGCPSLIPPIHGDPLPCVNGA